LICGVGLTGNNLIKLMPAAIAIITGMRPIRSRAAHFKYLNNLHNDIPSNCISRMISGVSLAIIEGVGYYFELGNCLNIGK